MPVSSSRERKTNPLAVPGRWRTMTLPATRTRVSFSARASSREPSPAREVVDRGERSLLPRPHDRPCGRLAQPPDVPQPEPYRMTGATRGGEAQGAPPLPGLHRAEPLGSGDVDREDAKAVALRVLDERRG